MNSACKICGNQADNKLYQVREMMFGYRDAFEYFECSSCGCLQIANLPPDFRKYYPPEYGNSTPAKLDPAGTLRRHARNWLSHSIVCDQGPFGNGLLRLYPKHALWSLRRTRVSLGSRILDVGCAGGHLLLRLWDAGFRNLLGVDPYIEQPIEYPGGLRVLKRGIDEIEGEWDLIMFHHSFEHVADPVAALGHCAAILARDGCCLIRMPVARSYAWRNYGIDWVQIDAPRHCFLYSVPSIRVLAGRVGLMLIDVIYDSTEFQFWASEQYRRDIPLRSAQSHWVNPKASVFSPSQLQDFRAQAERLNAKRDGDQAAFYLRKVTGTPQDNGGLLSSCHTA